MFYYCEYRAEKNSLIRLLNYLRHYRYLTKTDSGYGATGPDFGTSLAS